MRTQGQCSTQIENSFEPVPFRIRIGVTGHRILPDAECVRQSVLHALKTTIPTLFSGESQQKVHDTLSDGFTPLAFSILSPLAEGADRVVAKAVLELPGSRLEVALPLPVDEYKRDFADAESCSEFDRLLALCSGPTCLSASQKTSGCGSQPSFDRKEAYEAVGRYVVTHCDVLLAVWDNQPARGRGGTAEIVAYAEEQHIPVLHIWNGQVTFRNRDRFIPLDAEALCGLDRWNRAHVKQEKYLRAFNDENGELFGPMSGAPGEDARTPALPDEVKHLVRTKLLTYYARSSAIAEACRDRYQGGGWKIYTFSAAAVGCAALGQILGESHLIPYPEVVAQVSYLAEFVLLVVMVFLLKRTHHAQTHPDWIENRFLTERIRCAAFLAICGMRAEPIEIPPFMGSQEIDRSWMARVLDEMWERIPQVSRFEGTEIDRLRQYISQRWMCGQIDYHHAKAGDHKRYLQQLTRAGEIIVPVTIVVAFVHFVMGFHTSESQWLLVFHMFLAILALVLPAVAAALAGIETYREFKRLSVRSATMETRLKQLDRRLLSSSTPDEFLQVLRKIDKVMLQETQDWMTLMRHVEIKAG